MIRLNELRDRSRNRQVSLCTKDLLYCTYFKGELLVHYMLSYKNFNRIGNNWEYIPENLLLSRYFRASVNLQPPFG